MPIIKTTLLSIALLYPTLSMAKSNETSITSILGTDSNPYRFAKQFSHNTRSYLDLKVSGKYYLTKRWASLVKLNNRQYQQTDDWADSQSVEVALKYNGRSKNAPSEFKINVKNSNKTYVSRLSGGLSTFSGKSLDNRYDFKLLKTHWKKQKNIQKHLSWQYQVQYKIKDYQNFNTINISDMDYQSVNFENTFFHKINKRQQDEFNINVSYRHYKNKEQNDPLGNDIPNTRLDYLDAKIAYEHSLKTTKNHKLALALSHEKRVDNGSGYDDSHKSKIEIRSRLRVNNTMHFTSSYYFSDYTYERDDTPNSASTEEEYTAQSKHQIRLNTRVDLKSYLHMDARWLMAYRYEQINADKAQYSYVRHQIETGLKFTF